MKQENQEKVWDAIAEQWYHFRHQQFKDIAKEIKNLAKLKKGKVLEIGCGNCRNLKTFALKGFDCYGIDFSKEMIKYAKKYCKKYNFKVKLKKARAEKLPFKSNSVDYVLCIATLHHLKPHEQAEAVKEMQRVLKPNGIALVAVWNKKVSKAQEKYISWKIKGKNYWRYYYLFTMPELKKLFEKHGFKILRQRAGKNLIIIVRKI
ncbi:MAG: class I SAM-dependent methyltransferase [Candidatus Pacearchaeota archaeon]|nr:class I SAM-dependent methyltransferase [Candidatus Pacearchaeota archaeon]